MIGFVVLISVVLLAMMFRSIAVPLKAAVMNLLSVGAAYGVLTAVFQWGWGLQLLGIDHSRPVSSWLPILMFTILFGLSMDYEVFLLSRVKEDWPDTGDPHGSVARGLASTSRVITAAAAIMVMVFFGFVTEMDALIRMLGFGMGVAILLGRHGRPDGAGAGHDDARSATGTGGCRAGSTGSCRSVSVGAGVAGPQRAPKAACGRAGRADAGI